VKKIAIIDSAYSLKKNRYGEFKKIYSYDYCVPGTNKITDLVLDLDLNGILYAQHKKKIKEKDAENLAAIANTIGALISKRKEKVTVISESIKIYKNVLDRKESGRAFEKYAITNFAQSKGFSVKIFEDYYFQTSIGISKISDSGKDCSDFIERYNAKMIMYRVRKVRKALFSILSLYVAYLISITMHRLNSNVLCFAHCEQAEWQFKDYFEKEAEVRGISKCPEIIRYDKISGRAKILTLFGRISGLKLSIIVAQYLLKIILSRSSKLRKNRDLIYSIVIPSLIASEGFMDPIDEYLCANNNENILLVFGSDDFWSRKISTIAECKNQAKTLFISHGLLCKNEIDNIKKKYDYFVHKFPSKAS